MLDNAIINLENYYEINENLLNDFDKKKKNYYLFVNINELGKNNNLIINDMKNILKNDGFTELINDSINIMNKMDIKYKRKKITFIDTNIGNKSEEKVKIYENYFNDINEYENSSNIKKFYENFLMNDKNHFQNSGDKFSKLLYAELIAEQCNFYEDMLYFMKNYIKNKGDLLSWDERNLFSIACKNFVSKNRSALRTILAYEN